MFALAGCQDPCATLSGDPTLQLGGSDADGLTFEAFADGAPRPLVSGGQGGMHVWLSARISGVCPTVAFLDRRVVDDATGETYYFASGRARFVDGPSVGVFDLYPAEPMFVCPNSVGGPVVGHPLRFVAAIDDDDGRHAEAELSFVPECPDGVSCELYGCGP